MCGIAGGLNHSLSPADEQAVFTALAPRGPDHQGIWRQPGIWLANTRLAIQDLSPAGNQPMLSADGRCTIVYNGELYNTAELRQRLQQGGHTFSSHCDTEVLLRAYLAWGPQCLDHIEGDFAFAIWDELAQRLFLARDPMGVKPLYYYQQGSTFLFASDIRTLCAISDLDRSLAPEVLGNYLSLLYSPTEATPFRYVHKLLPGHSFSLSTSDVNAEPCRYYSIPMKGHRRRPEPDWHQDLRSTLRTVIDRQLHADVPVGIMLSGGLDSSLIAAIARSVQPELPLHAFCISTGSSLSDEGFEDDLPFARHVAQHLGLPLQEIPHQLPAKGAWIDTMIQRLGEPQADPAAWYVSEMAQAARDQGVKVLLSGAGGDDLFAGYRRHLAARVYPLLQFLPGQSAALTQMLPARSAFRRRLSKLLNLAGSSPLEAALSVHCWTPFETITDLLQPELQRTPTARLLASLLEEIPDEDRLLQQMLFIEQRSFLPHHNLAYTDKMAMAFSVEARVPFADRALVDLAAAMPPELKLHRHTTKWILRQVARPLLPEEILKRGKTGFGAPLRQWMSSELQPLLRQRLLDPSFSRYGIFQPASVERLIQQQAEGKGDVAYTLFSLLCIESWLRQFAAHA